MKRLTLKTLSLAAVLISVGGCGANTPVNSIDDAQPVAVVFDQDVNAGVTTVVWDQRNDSGKMVGPGIYFAELESSYGTTSKTFRISIDAVVAENDDITVPSHPPIPNQITFDISSELYGLGDSVEFEFAMPYADHVRLTILRSDPNSY